MYSGVVATITAQPAGGAHRRTRRLLGVISLSSRLSRLCRAWAFSAAASSDETTARSSVMAEFNLAIPSLIRVRAVKCWAKESTESGIRVSPLAHGASSENPLYCGSPGKVTARLN